MPHPHGLPFQGLSPADIVRRNPFQIFFPLGVLAGVVGVGHWTLWSSGWPVESVSLLHAAFQSQGFLAFFVVGFLLTALPRFTGTDYATLPEILWALAGGLTFLTAALGRRWGLAQAGFLIMLSLVPFFAIRRLRRRTKELPPSFALLGFGLLHAVTGSILLAATRMGQEGLPAFQAGRQMVQLGFLLCMVMGVTAKLAPFLTGYVDISPRDEQSVSPLKDALPHAATGLLLFMSFALEPAHPAATALLRAALVTAHLVLFAKIGRFPRKRSTAAMLFWLSECMIPLGLWLIILLPRYRVALAHVVFIGGFSLMIFSFGLLIVLTHSAQAAALGGRMTALKVVAAGVLGALALRVSADFFAGHYVALVHSASGLWVAAALVWLAYVLKKTTWRASP